MISVIIPVYKVEDFLDRCVQSVVDQTYKDLEIILVDDGSPDNCPKMCDDWAKKDSRVKVIHKENAGVCVARNTAIDQCNGDFIAFLDSDDYADKDLYQKLYEDIVKYNTDISCCAYKYVEMDGTVLNATGKNFLFNEGKMNGREFIVKVLEREVMTVVWNKLYRMSAVKETRFKPGVIGEEMLFFFDMITEDNSVSFIKDPLYYYLRREGSLSFGFNEKFYFDNVKNIISSEELLKQKFIGIEKHIKKCQLEFISWFLSNMPMNYVTDNRESYAYAYYNLRQNSKYISKVGLPLYRKIYLRLYIFSPRLGTAFSKIIKMTNLT